MTIVESIVPDNTELTAQLEAANLEITRLRELIALLQDQRTASARLIEGPLMQLTNKERACVELAIQGLSNIVIAATLGTTKQCVKNCLSSDDTQFGILKRTELAARLLQRAS